MLHQLANSGDVAGLRQHLENDVRDVDSLDIWGNTPLLCADYTMPEIVNLLLQHGADVDVRNDNAESPLRLAMKSGCIESVRLILDAGVNSEQVFNEALFMAILKGMLPIAKLLLERGADPNMHHGPHNISLLNTAISRGESMVNLLLEHGADPNKRDGEGCTPLYYAAQSRNTTMTRRLIEAGAKIVQHDIRRGTNFYRAVYLDNLERLKFLVENGAKVATSDQNEWTVLHEAIYSCDFFDPQSEARCLQELFLIDQSEEGINQNQFTSWRAINSKYSRCLQLIKYLLESGADCDKPDDKGVTPLLLALQMLDVDNVRYLLERGADLKAKDRNGWTGLHYAAINEQTTETLEFMLDQDGFHVGDRTRDGFTALHCAAMKGAVNSCALLLKRGADVNAKCNEDQTPLYWATFYDQSPTIVLLLGHGAEAALESILRKSRRKLINDEDYDKDDDDEWERACLILRHLAKLECLIGIEHRAKIVRNDEAQEYFKLCVAELRRMEVCKIFEDVSLMDIWTKSESVLAGYARNEELVQGFEDKNDEEEFLIFADIVAKRFNKVVERWRKLVAAATVLDGIFGLTNDPEHVIYRKIFGYLKDDDFKHLWMEVS